MRWFGRFIGRKKSDAPAPVAAMHQAPDAVESPDNRHLSILASLASLGTQGGPTEDQALELLRKLAGGPTERAAIQALSSARLRTPLPHRIALSAAELLVARGEVAAALQMLDGCASVPALMLRADLLFEGGQIAQAVSVLERALARDISAPGGRERHQRWRALLAPQRRAEGPSADVTIAVPSLEHSPFRVLREVARGGAGAIYEAFDDALGRRVALKIYHRISDRQDLEQMRREAQLAVQLAGPGIVQVLDVNYAQRWIALEWVDMASLREVLARRDGRDTLLPMHRWLAPLARAMARVHAQGLVHGDLKPANVLMRAVDEPVLSDFGISSRRGTPSLGGSPGYQSPERLAGAAVEPTDDVYGFGRILDDIITKVEDARSDERILRLAELCMAPTGERPEDGQCLISALERLLA